MKTRADIEGLKRDLDQRLKVLKNDSVFLDSPRGRYAITVLEQRREVAEMVGENLILLDWVFNHNTDIKRADLVDQDKV
jgi:hypothetical protein|tara:strand:- start:1141 stop:1377 length:237 start_codon:yes stop_codon:yes gene_type:complete